MRWLLDVKMNQVCRIGLFIGLFSGLGLLVRAVPFASAAPTAGDKKSHLEQVAQRTIPTPLPPQKGDDEQPHAVVLNPRSEPSAPNLALVISGAGVLGVPWVLSVFVTAIAGSGTDYLHPSRSGPADYSTRWPMFIPAVGPFIQLAYVNRHDYFGLSPLCDASLVADGVIQTVGLALLIAGAVTRQHGDGHGTSDIAVAPLLTPGGSGLMVRGRF